jgi:hypothetical protein
VSHVDQFARNLLESTDRGRHVADCDLSSRASEPGGVVRRLEGCQPNGDFGDACFVAAIPTLFTNRVQVGSCVNEQVLSGGHVRRAQQHDFVVGTDFENFLVERSCLGPETLAAKVVGNANEDGHRFVYLARSKIQIAQDIRRIPIARLVVEEAAIFRNRLFQLSPLQELFGIAKERVTINGHESINRIKRRLRPERPAVRV